MPPQLTYAHRGGVWVSVFFVGEVSIVGEKKKEGRSDPFPGPSEKRKCAHSTETGLHGEKKKKGRVSIPS